MSEEFKEGKIEKPILAREPVERYSDLIKNVNLIKAKSAYADLLVRELEGEEYAAFLAERVRGSTVLDLGSGQSPSAQRFFGKFSPERYIAVDLEPVTGASIGKLPPFSLALEEEEIVVDPDKKVTGMSDKSHAKEVPLRISQSATSPEGVNILKIQGDMLDAISRLEDGSVGTIVFSGIEIAGGSEANAKYLEALRAEMRRVLKTEGLVIVYHSDFRTDKFNLLKKINDGGIYRPDRDTSASVLER